MHVMKLCYLVIFLSVAACAPDVSGVFTVGNAGGPVSGGQGGQSSTATSSHGTDASTGGPAATTDAMSSSTVTSGTTSGGVTCDACGPEQCEPAHCSDGSYEQCDTCSLPKVCQPSAGVAVCSSACLSQDEDICANAGQPSAWGVPFGCNLAYRIENQQAVFRPNGTQGCSYYTNGPGFYWCCP